MNWLAIYPKSASAVLGAVIPALRQQTTRSVLPRTVEQVTNSLTTNQPESATEPAPTHMVRKRIQCLGPGPPRFGSSTGAHTHATKVLGNAASEMLHLRQQRT